jgi:predicted nuclease of predicted toxin-antitoxin system
LSLGLYLDDCANSRELQGLLEEDGHRVITPANAGLLGADDEDHFLFARQHNLVLLTKNPGDFVALHRQHPDHPGMFLVYQDNDVTRDMTNDEIVSAIRNIVSASVPIAGQIHSLNHWRY